MQQVIAKLKKNFSNEIWVTLSEYGGEKRIDIREYFRSDDVPDFHPTKKGFSITINKTYELIELIESMENEDTIGTTKILEISKGVQLEAGNREYQNHKYKELRIYFFSKKNGQWSPTKKGVTLKSDLVQQLRESIEQAMDFVTS